MRAGSRLGIREVEDGRIGLFGVNAVEDLLKVSGSAAARLGHLAELVAARVDLERVDGTVVHRLAADRHVHRDDRDTVALALLRRDVRTGLDHDDVLTHKITTNLIDITYGEGAGRISRRRRLPRSVRDIRLYTLKLDM